MSISLPLHGRGAGLNPANRFDPIAFEWDGDALDAIDPEDRPSPKTQFLRDNSRSIISHNDSPDVGFSDSINPYRGCEHGCIYCYARPTHEYLSFSAGLDFETKIMVKETAPQLLREALMAKKYQPVLLNMSGVTDCYQPVERKLKLTRGCLEVLLEFRNPVTIITKNHLVTRDIDLLSQFAKFDGAVVLVSVTTLDPELARKMEPRTSSPKRRLEAIADLHAAGVPVGVMVAPVIPGLTDHEMASILKAAGVAGARCAAFTPVRLPGAVAPLFEQWLTDHFPDRKEKVLNRIRSLRGGKLNDPNFGSRMRGEGQWADHLRDLFHVAKKKAGITRRVSGIVAGAFQKASWTADGIVPGIEGLSPWPAAAGHSFSAIVRNVILNS
jgi:DNA repair photolyase